MERPNKYRGEGRKKGQEKGHAKGQGAAPVNERQLDISTEPVIRQIRESLSETISENVSENVSESNPVHLRNDNRYKYIVQPGDTIESVALVVLQDSTLAALLFNINRRYILPEEQYGVHPLMVGVVIQLPTPGDVIKFRKARQGLE